MTPVVEAALISGGWATAVAALGYFYNRATARATIRATTANAMAALDAAHAAQHWEKRSDAYLETLTLIMRRQAERGHMTSPFGYDEATEEKLRKSYADPADWDWAKASAQLTAYASQAVLDAMHAVEDTAGQVTVKVWQWKALTDQVRSGLPGGPTGEQVLEAHGEVEAAASAAVAADTALMALIRADLALKPSDADGSTRPAVGPSSRPRPLPPGS